MIVFRTNTTDIVSNLPPPDVERIQMRLNAAFVCHTTNGSGLTVIWIGLICACDRSRDCYSGFGRKTGARKDQYDYLITKNC